MHETTRQRLAVLFVFGILLFNYPLLKLFSTPALWLGFPALYAYLFLAWAVLIALIAIAVER